MGQKTTFLVTNLVHAVSLEPLVIISRHAYEVSEVGIVIDLFLLIISRHAYEVSEAGIVIDLFLLIIILQEPKSCCVCISRTACYYYYYFNRKPPRPSWHEMQH